MPEMNRNDDVEFSLKIMTLNVWGLPYYFAKDKETRLHAIAKHISTSDYDIVCLQELWCIDDYELLLSYTHDKMPYDYYFHSGINGSGLCILSKWPITEALFYKWPLNGYLHMIHHADWYGGKGVGLLRVSINGIFINVYTTHLHAQYDKKKDRYIAHRLLQAYDTAMFIKMTSGNAAISILAGDLNSNPDDICTQIINIIGNFKDTYIAHDPDSAIGTNGCIRNSYCGEKYKCENPNGDRIDYILFKGGNGIHSEVESYWFPLENTIPGKTFSYSDHEAIATQLLVKIPTTKDVQTSVNGTCELVAVLEESMALFDDATHTIESNIRMHNALLLFYIFVLFAMPAFSDLPRLYSAVYQILIMSLMLFFIFSFFMAIMWYKKEMKAILGAKLGMRLLLNEAKKMKN